MADIAQNTIDLSPSTIPKEPTPIIVQSSPTKSRMGFSQYLGIGVLGIIGYILMNKDQEKKEDKEQEKREQEFSDNLTNEKLKDERGATYNPRELAARYKQTIYGPGTSEQALMDLARISKYGRWENISAAYKKLTKGNLNNDIQGELSTDEYTIFQKILKSNFWFAVGEYVYPKKDAVIIYENKKLKIESFYWTYSVGKAIGKIKAAKKVKYKDKVHVFYLTTGYPTKWILSKHLITKYDRTFG